MIDQISSGIQGLPQSVKELGREFAGVAKKPIESFIYDPKTKRNWPRSLYWSAPKFVEAAQKGKITPEELMDIMPYMTLASPASSTTGITNETLKQSRLAGYPQAKTTPVKPEAFSDKLEMMEGWQKGMKSVFDTAMLHGDKQTVEELLPFVPEDYKIRFATEIKNLLGK